MTFGQLCMKNCRQGLMKIAQSGQSDSDQQGGGDESIKKLFLVFNCFVTAKLSNVSDHESAHSAFDYYYYYSY